MEEDVKSIGDYLSIGWRRRYYFLIPFVLFSSVAIIAVKLLPPVYRSTGTILIESQQIPEEFIQSTVTGFADERIQIINQRIMTSQQLLPIIEKYGLGGDVDENTTQIGVVDSVRNRIFVDRISSGSRGRGSTIAFSVAFEDRSPEIAQKVASELVTLFLDQNLKARKERAGETTEFLEQEALRLQSEIELIEEQIAQFKAENEGRLPENLAINLGRVDDLQRRLLELERERTELTNNRVLLEIDLGNTAKYLATGAIGGDPDRQMAELVRLENELVRLSARYGVEHPDVKALVRQISAYEQQFGKTSDHNSRILEQITQTENELADARQKYTAEHPDIKRLLRKLEGLRTISTSSSDMPVSSETRQNPKYLQLVARLNAINERIDTLTKSEKQFRTEIASLNTLIRQTPQVQRGLEALIRDYDSTRNEYRNMKAKQLQAELSMSLEEDQKGERFTLLEPPLLPVRPEKPDRKKLALLGILVSIFAGVGIVVLVESLDSGIYGARDLAQATKMTPLVAIPFIVTQAGEKQRSQSVRLAVASLVVLIVAILIGVHFLYKPIDIMWFGIISKLNLI